MDQIILDILSLVIGGTGLFVVITKYNDPETRRNFYGKIQVFKEKASIIDDIMTLIFTALSVLGLLALVMKDIYGDVIPERLYVKEYYWAVFGLGLIIALLLAITISWAGYRMARKKWLPLAISGYKEAFDLIINGNMLDEDPVRAAEFIQVMEKVFDVKPGSKQLIARFESLRPFFSDTRKQ